MIDDAVAAVDLIRHQTEVDPARVFVISHSLGAMLAPEIATRAKAKGVVMLAPPELPLPDTMDKAVSLSGSTSSDDCAV